MMLSVHLSHTFPGFTLDARFDAPEGVTALFGRSGSGKTTVVNAVAGLLTPNQGRVTVGDTVLLDTTAGITLPAHKRRVAYVFQEARLFPHLTVRQNLIYGRWIQRLPRDAGDEAHVTELLGLGALLARRPGALSGGERQRVALGRALLSSPRLLLMDEPLAALDQARKAEILPFLERLRDERRLPILYVSHALSEVARLATTVVALDKGRVVRAGPASDVLSDPEAVPALGVRDAGAILPCRLARHFDDGLSEVAFSGGTLLVPRIDAPPGTGLRIRIAASDVLLAQEVPQGLSALNVLPVTVEALRRGAQGGAIVQLRAGQDRLLSRISARAAERMGLTPGLALFAIVESVALARRDIGQNTEG